MKTLEDFKKKKQISSYFNKIYGDGTYRLSIVQKGLKEPITKSQDKPTQWDQWLAGLIDGDGYFYISKKGQAYFEITTAIEDERMLQIVKQKIGGRVTPRSGSKSIRLRLGAKESLKNLLHRINGEIRHPSRIDQMQKICTHLDVVFQPPRPLDSSNAYMAGLFDSDGSITIGVHKTRASDSVSPGIYGKYLRLKNSKARHQLSLHIVSKEKKLLEQIQRALGFGSILREEANAQQSRPNPLYRYYFCSRDDCNKWLSYLRATRPLLSSKSSRCLMLQEYFDLKADKVHLESSLSIKHKQWDRFCRKWHRVDI